ncbi:MAG: erythromycin esterase family protein [Alphaproteobacteria bacterium]|nr:erythromycin esterase family protein [Alphaproteobacteria bacterium]
MLALLAALAAASEAPVPLPSGLDLDTPDTELEPLGEIVDDAVLVGLGESKHCAGGYLEAKARIVQWLVERRGFRLVALETPWVHAGVAQRYVEAGEGTSEDAMDSVFGAFHDSGTRRMFEWLRSWNEAHPDDPVHFVGFDVQDRVQELETFAASAEPPWTELAEATLVVRRALEGVSGDALSEIRDAGMADTLLAIRQAVEPDARTIVLAHNAHLMRHGSETHFRNLGEHLSERLGDAYLAVGLVGHRVDSLCHGWTRHDGRHELERELAEELDAPAGWLDLSAPRWHQERSDVGGWSSILPGEQYDALLFLEQVRASDVADEDRPWSDADGWAAGGDRILALHRDEPGATALRSLWDRYAQLMERLGYAPASRVRTKRADRGQRQRFEGEAGRGELRVTWDDEDEGWVVLVVVDPTWFRRL